MDKAFKSMGYKTEIRTLPDYYDNYGLKGSDEDGGDDGEQGLGPEPHALAGVHDSPIRSGRMRAVRSR